MRVLITGATGFIGRLVGERLAERGHEVIALVRDPGARSWLEPAALRNIEPVRGDLLDSTSLARAVIGCSAVIHLAARVAPVLQDDVPAVYRENRDAAIELARLARGAGCKCFVFVSSIAAMGFFSGLATPESPCAPVTPYGHAKLQAERGIRALRTDAFLPVILRPPTVYGPGERYNFLSLTIAVARGVFRIIGRGHNVMPLCTRENLARAAIAGAEGTVPAGVHTVADDAHYPMTRVHAALTAALGVRPPTLHLPRAVAWLGGAANELLHHAGAPLVLSRSRVRTLTADQPFDVTSLRASGVLLDAPLELEVARTVDDYRRAGLLAR